VTASPCTRVERFGTVADDNQIDCDRALIELYEFLDGELTVERRARIELHLNGCQHCFASFDFEQEFRMVVRSKLQAEMPAQLIDRITRMLAFEDDSGPDSGR